MITKPVTLEEAKQLFIEGFFNNTDAVTKIAPLSVINGLAYGTAKLAQKSFKDIALVESNLFVDSAFGTTLDTYADRNGVAPRFGASESSTYIRLVGDVGTTYLRDTHFPISTSGILFQLEQDNIVLGDLGYTYAKVRSQSQGSETNVDSLSINQLTSTPTGHQYIINEYAAIGGQDIESDILFRNRIKQNLNILAQGTLGMLTQVFNKMNNNVLRVIYKGTSDLGKNILTILTSNGIDLTTNELDLLKKEAKKYLNLSELNPFEENWNSLILENVTYYPIDISARIKLNAGYTIASVRKEMQIEFSKAVDYRFWKSTTK